MKGKQKIKIINIGPSLKTQGGISSVLQIYKKMSFDGCDMSFISSYHGGGRHKDIAFFISAIVKVILESLRAKNLIFQIHTSSKGSFLRKTIIAQICIWLKRPYIMHIHGSKFDVFYEGSPEWLKRRIRYTLCNAERVIALSNQWKDILYNIVQGKKEIDVVYNPTPFSDNVIGKSAADSEIPVFLFTGRYGERKGAYDLIKAVSNVKTSGMRLAMYGDGEIDKVGKMVKELNLQDKVEINKWVEHDKIKDIYLKSDVLVLPSYAEGLPMSVLEAIGMGMPVITTNVGGIPEAVHDNENGFLLTPGDIESLASKIELLAKSPDMRKRFGEASKKIADKSFSSSSISKVLEKVYREILKYEY